jgi:hypothetical protein
MPGSLSPARLSHLTPKDRQMQTPKTNAHVGTYLQTTKRETDRERDGQTTEKRGENTGDGSDEAGDGGLELADNRGDLGNTRSAGGGTLNGAQSKGEDGRGERARNGHQGGDLGRNESQNL